MLRVDSSLGFTFFFLAKNGLKRDEGSEVCTKSTDRETWMIYFVYQVFVCTFSHRSLLFFIYML